MTTPLILIVDDLPQNVQVLAQHLERAGYDVAIANSGEKALEITQSITPNLILLDVMMPGLNGYQTCQALKESSKTKNIPVIFLTAKSDPEDIKQGFEHGAADYIYKPFSAPELLARVETHLSLQLTTQQLRNAHGLLYHLLTRETQFAFN